MSSGFKSKIIVPILLIERRNEEVMNTPTHSTLQQGEPRPVQVIAHKYSKCRCRVKGLEEQQEKKPDAWTQEDHLILRHSGGHIHHHKEHG